MLWSVTTNGYTMQTNDTRYGIIDIVYAILTVARTARNVASDAEHGPARPQDMICATIFYSNAIQGEQVLVSN